jgi:hypothetical protein
MNYEGIPPCDLRFLTIFNLGIFLPIGKQEQPRLFKDNLKIKYRRPKKLLVSDGDHRGCKPWNLVPEPFQSICCGHCYGHVYIMETPPTAKNHDQLYCFLSLLT